MDIYRRMKEVFRRIPDGCVTTYGQVALLCGAPRHSRQVGYALRTNRLGDVPAFRVINSTIRDSRKNCWNRMEYGWTPPRTVTASI